MMLEVDSYDNEELSSNEVDALIVMAITSSVWRMNGAPFFSAAASLLIRPTDFATHSMTVIIHVSAVHDVRQVVLTSVLVKRKLY